MTEHSYLCQYIKEHPNWREELSTYPYFIRIKDDDGLTIFNYDLTTSFSLEDDTIKRIDFTIPEVQEARGIIINTKTLEVVCWPFRKFGNYLESYVDNIDWDTAKIQEKIDGSIMKLFYDKRPNRKLWRIATNGMIDAFKAEVVLNSINFGNIFLEATQNTVLEDVLDPYKEQTLDKDKTYIFELVSPYTRVVVDYPEAKVYHLGTRDNITGQEEIVDIGIEKPKEYPLQSLDECVEAATKLNQGKETFNITQEGFVVVDKDFHRIKIKSPNYVLIHHSIGSGKLAKKDIYKLLLENELEEFLTYFPMHKRYIDYFQKKYDKLIYNLTIYCKEVENIYDQLQDRKLFSLKIEKDIYKSFAFRYVFNHNSIEEILQKTRLSKLDQLIEEVDSIDVYEKNPSLQKKAIQIETR